MAPFLKLSGSIGGEVAECAALVDTAFKGVKELVIFASKHKKPKDETKLREVMTNLVFTHIRTAMAYKKDHNRSKVYNHINAMAEGLGSLQWVAMPKPTGYLRDSIPSAEFSTNKILREFKGKDDTHVNWVKAYTGLLKSQIDYVKSNHMMGLTWNRKGTDVGSAPSSTASSSTPKSTSTSTSSKPSKSEAQGSAKGGLFAQLNAGGNITSGLKKVTRDMQTHKNKALRASGKVSVEPKKAKKPSKFSASKNKKIPAKFELDGKTWRVEGQYGNKGLVIEETNGKQALNMYKCEGSVIRIPEGKIGSVLIDSCKKCALVFQNVISSVELVNCSSIKVQCLGRLPTVAIDKTDGAQVFLSQACCGANATKVITSKSSEVNVIGVIGDEPVESAVPEQIVSSLNAKGKLSSVFLVHSG